jgi:hypothetical protein
MREEEIRLHVGKRVTLKLKPEAPGAPTVTGYFVGTIEAADGLIVYLEPEDPQPEAVLGVHYHYIVSISPAAS